MLGAERGLLGRGLHGITLAGFKEVTADTDPVIRIGFDQGLHVRPVVAIIDGV